MNVASLMPVDQALERLLQAAVPVTGVESIPLAEALGRVLAEPVYSSVNVPPADNSAVDGYVVDQASLNQSEPCTVPVVARIPAGSAPSALPAGGAGRIFTGASIPENGKAVIMQEDCEVDADQVTVPAGIDEQRNIRPAGQDIRAGERVLSAGRCLHPQDLGLLASTGIARVSVRRKLRVAIFSTGDELVEPGHEAGPGQIFNSNRYTMLGLLQRSGCEVIDLGTIADNLQLTVEAFERGAAQADLILTSGGVSVGEEDHVKAAMLQLGQLDLWRIAIKPGKPLAFGQARGTPVIGLPGNPSAVFVTFCILAKAFIGKMQGQGYEAPLGFQVSAGFDLPAGKRQEYLRVRVVTDEQGRAQLEAFPNQSSGVLISSSWAQGFAVVPPGREVHKGELLEFISFASLGL